MAFRQITEVYLLNLPYYKALISSQKVEANKQAQSQTNKTINLSGHKRENRQAELLSHAVKRKQ